MSQKAPSVKSGKSLMEWFCAKGAEWQFHALKGHAQALIAAMAIRRGDERIFAAAYGAACGHVFRCHELFYDRGTV